jgi:cyclase
MLAEDIQHWKEFVDALQTGGPKYLINTHSHFEHCIGNHKLGGIVVMHERDRELMEAYNEETRVRKLISHAFPALTDKDIQFIISEPRVPSEITIRKDLTFHMGDCTVKVFHAGGHTEGSICAYIPEHKTLITGDNLASNRHPVKTGANIRQWIQALKFMKRLKIDTIIPGHGAVCGEDELNRCLEYFLKLWSTVEDLVRRKASRSEVVAEVHRRMIDYYAMDEEAEGKDRIQGLKDVFDMGTERVYDEVLAFGKDLEN